MGKIADATRTWVVGQEQRRQLLAFDTELEKANEKVRLLEAQILDLEQQVNPLQRQVEGLKKQLQEQTAKAVRAAKLAQFKSEKTAQTEHVLESAEIEMMQFVGDKKSASAEEIGKGMVLHSVVVEHFLGHLLKAGFLEQHPGYGVAPVHYSLSDKGNAYLYENKLIPVPSQQTQAPDNPKSHRCDHCGSTKLKRTGSRPDPTFHAVGVKQALYNCLDCQQESAFTNDEAQA